MNQPETQNTDLSGVRFFARHFPVIWKSTTIAAALTAIITFFIPNEYLSYGIIFPTWTNSLESTVDNPMFGYDVEADRVMQILQSKEIQDSISKKFNLVKYYDLDSTDPKWHDKLRKYFMRDIAFSRTNYMSITISAQTEDPEMSMGIVNEIIALVDPIRNRILKSNIQKAHDAFEKDYLWQKAKVDTLIAEINTLRNVQGNPPISVIVGSLHNFPSTGTSPKQNTTLLETKINLYLQEQAALGDIRNKFEKARMQLERPLPSIYIIDKAIPSYKKVFPSFTINVLLVSFCTLIITLIVLSLRERIEEIKKAL